MVVTFNSDFRPDLASRVYRGFFILGLCALALGGCAGFKPQDNPERIAWVQEKLDTTYKAIESAYEVRRTITREEKDYALSKWQPVKDASDVAIRDYALGEDDMSPMSVTRQMRALIRDLVDMGILEAGE